MGSLLWVSIQADWEKKRLGHRHHTEEKPHEDSYLYGKEKSQAEPSVPAVDLRLQVTEP